MTKEWDFGEKCKTVADARRMIQKMKRKVESNIKLLTKYSTLLVNEQTYFDSIRAQKVEVQDLIYENVRLAEEIRMMSIQIDYTNTITIIQFIGKPYRVRELVCMLRQTLPTLIKTQEAMGKKKGKISKRLFNERTRNQTILKLKDMVDEIPHLIDELNRITQLLDLPPGF